MSDTNLFTMWMSIMAFLTLIFLWLDDMYKKVMEKLEELQKKEI